MIAYNILNFNNPHLESYRIYLSGSPRCALNFQFPKRDVNSRGTLWIKYSICGEKEHSKLKIQVSGESQTSNSMNSKSKLSTKKSCREENPEKIVYYENSKNTKKVPLQSQVFICTCNSFIWFFIYIYCLDLYTSTVLVFKEYSSLENFGLIGTKNWFFCYFIFVHWTYECIQLHI